MSLRRKLAVVCAVVIAGTVAFSATDGWARGSSAPQSPAPLWNGGSSASTVKKDDSQMTVVGNNDLDRNVPLVDVATNGKLKKKQPPSFWSRLTHPSQWFGSSKTKK